MAMKRSVRNRLEVFGIMLLVVIAIVAGFIWGTDLASDSGKKGKTAEKELSKEQFLDDFKEISTIVQERYSHLESKQIDSDSLYIFYSERVESAETSSEYREVLLAYFSELKNMHTGLSLNPTHFIDCRAKLVDNRVFIEHVGRLERMVGVTVKDEVLSVDGTPTLEWLREAEKFVNASTDEARLNEAVGSIFSSYESGKRTLELRSATGVKEVELHFRKRSSVLTSTVINDSIAYLAINSMRDGVVEDFREEFERLRSMPYLIVDVRNNGGGNSGYSEEIAEYLIQKEQIACVSERELTPQEDHYRGKLVVLIGINTASAAESFVLDLKESGNVVLIGSPTGGDTGNRPRNFITKHGTNFRIPIMKPAQISPQGFPMEGVGIEPHITIYETVDDYLNGIDRILEFAVEKVIEL